MFLKVERRFLSFYSMLLVNSCKTLIISGLFSLKMMNRILEMKR